MGTTRRWRSRYGRRWGWSGLEAKVNSPSPHPGLFPLRRNCVGTPFPYRGPNVRPRAPGDRRGVGFSRRASGSNSAGLIVPTIQQAMRISPGSRQCTKLSAAIMDGSNSYRELMEQIRQFHQRFTQRWHEARSAELRKHGIDPAGDFRGDGEIQQVWQANGIAYTVAVPQSTRRDELLESLFSVKADRKPSTLSSTFWKSTSLRFAAVTPSSGFCTN